MTDRPKRKKAVSLRYEPAKDQAPVLTAKGEGVVAEKILALAREHYIPVREDRVLVQALSTLAIDQQIPTEAYAAVAEILAFLHRLQVRR